MNDANEYSGARPQIHGRFHLQRKIVCDSAIRSMAAQACLVMEIT
jgi:hypothetical protein